MKIVIIVCDSPAYEMWERVKDYFNEYCSVAVEVLKAQAYRIMDAVDRFIIIVSPVNRQRQKMSVANRIRDTAFEELMNMLYLDGRTALVGV